MALIYNYFEIGIPWEPPG